LKNGRHDFQLFTKEIGRVVNPFCGLNTPRAKRCTAIIEVSQAAMNHLGRLTTEVTENTEEKTERKTLLKNWNFSPPSVNSVCSVVNNPNFLVAALDRRSWRHRLSHGAGVMKI
jgi:hypothetical protein